MITPDRAEEMLAGGLVCAWDGCEASYKGPQPDGWYNLITCHTPKPILDLAKMPNSAWGRDGVLCPEHNKALEALLKPLAREILTADPAGEA